MDIHVVKPGETLYSIALEYGVPMSRLINDNQFLNPARLVVGQTVVIQFPGSTYVVRPQDTLSSIARDKGLTVRQLLRNNPVLRGEDRISVGQELVLTYQPEQESALTVNAYAYPEIAPALLQSTLPYLSQLTPFTYRITAEGGLVALDDVSLVAAAHQMGVTPIMHVSTLSAGGTFSSELAHVVLGAEATQQTLAACILKTILTRGYRGLDLDFEYLYSDDAPAYVRFSARMRELLAPYGYPVTVAVAPKAFANQPGLLYEGHAYRLLGEAADFVFLMTYEWGYTYGPPMAVAPIRSVRQVVEYALTEVPAEKLLLGIPNYGYDWQIPYAKSRPATSISNQHAVALAARHYAAIRYDESAQSPWFRYVDGAGQEHEVWFEDARSIRAKLSLAGEYGLHGVGYWNLMQPFPQNWLVLNALCQIQ